MELKTNCGAVIFDFDGTILDSVRVTNFYRVAESRGLVVPECEGLEKHHGKKASQIIKTLWPEEDTNQFIRDWEEIDVVHPQPLINGVHNTLSFLRNLGTVEIGILTSRRHGTLFPLLQNLEIINYFNPDLLQAIDNWEYHKPDPRAFDEIIRKLVGKEISREQTIYVGDSSVDWEAASGAGVRFVGVESGILNRSDWKNLGVSPKDIIVNMGWLPHWMSKHF